MILDFSADNRGDAADIVLALVVFFAGSIGKTEVDPPVFAEFRMQCHFHHPALAVFDNRRSALDDLRIEFPLGSEEAEVSGFFGHQLAAVGEESDGPRVFEAIFHEGLDLVSVQLGPGDGVWRGFRKIHALREGLFFLFAEEDDQRADLVDG